MRRKARDLPGRRPGSARPAPHGAGATAPTPPGRALPFALLATLAACAPMPDPDVTVRHFGSTAYRDGQQLRVFVFDPAAERSLDERIRLARAEIARDPACRWGDASRDVIEAATRRQGRAYAGTLLAAPVICDT